MRWRDFIAGLGAAGRSFAARAQQCAVPVIGYLSVGPPELSVRNAVVASLLQRVGWRRG
jgi:phosphoglycerate dehydrogenase-like enzyme